MNKGGMHMAKVTKDMTIAEVLRLDEGTAPIFMQYGMHCLGCPVSTGESIEQAAAVHGIDADELINALNEYLEDK
jgi:hybrid cluster-associated redox disulfide protein